MTTAKVGLVTESEIEAFDQANKGRLRGDESKLREGIRAHLQEQKRAARRAQLRLISGAQPLEAFIRLIDQELARP